MTKKIVALAGVGIGPEIMEAGLAVLEALTSKTGWAFGGAGIDVVGILTCREADAILPLRLSVVAV